MFPSSSTTDNHSKKVIPVWPKGLAGMICVLGLRLSGVLSLLFFWDGCQENCGRAKPFRFPIPPDRQPRRCPSPKISCRVISFPSLSVPRGHAKRRLCGFLLSDRRCIKISFSIQRAAKVASFVPFPVWKLSIALIRPMVPMEMRSSRSSPVLSNFLTMCATNLRLCSISLLRESA